jgi:hypothetical protein
MAATRAQMTLLEESTVSAAQEFSTIARTPNAA